MNAPQPLPENVIDMVDHRQRQALPGTDELLKYPVLEKLIQKHGRALVTFAIRDAIDQARQLIPEGKEMQGIEGIVAAASALVAEIGESSLRPVINATGIVLHTNLGRAPLGPGVINELAAIAGGYSNLEFDLNTGRRGSRHTHLRKILSFLTGAEDALVVNNNAAGIMLALNVLAQNREVVIARSELIEIGDSFRLPEIMTAGGARVVAVGTTNRTYLADYESAIGSETAMLLKAHQSNFAIKGFTAVVPLRDLADLAHQRGLIMMYDIGSGLLRKPRSLSLSEEPDVTGAIADQADLVAFSADKLLGGPQAGVLVGRKDLIAKISRAPLMRALRTGTLTIAALSAACRGYLRDEELPNVSPIFALLERSREDLEHLATSLLKELHNLGIEARPVESIGRCGGGTLPDLEINSMALELLPQDGIEDDHHTFAERLFERLLQANPPVLAVLREGRILLDVLTLFPRNIPDIARALAQALNRETNA